MAQTPKAIPILFSYRYLIPVTERQTEALYAFKGRGFGGEIEVGVFSDYQVNPDFY